MLSGMHETKFLRTQEIERYKHFSGNFCALNFADVIEKTLRKSGVGLQIPHDNIHDNASSIFEAAAATKTVSQSECQKTTTNSDPNFAQSKPQTYHTQSYSVEKNNFTLENVNFLFLAALPEISNNPLKSKIKSKSLKIPETLNCIHQETPGINSNNNASAQNIYKPTMTLTPRSLAGMPSSSKQFSDVKNFQRKEDATSAASFKCSYCPKVFPFQCHLQVHERVHTKEKPYKCNLCPRQFSQLGSLTVHQRIHTGETPYHCFSCSKKFRHVNSLKRHQRQLHFGKNNCFKKKRAKADDEVEVSCKKARNFHPETGDIETRKIPAEVNKISDDTPKCDVTALFQRAKENDAKTSSNCVALKTHNIFKSGNREAFSDFAKNKPTEPSSKPFSNNKPSTSIFKSIEKLLSYSSNSEEKKETATLENANRLPIVSRNLGEKIELKTSALFLPHAAQTQTLTTPTLSYETNSISRWPPGLFLDNNLLSSGFRTHNNVVNQQNLLLFPSLVFSNQFCKPIVGNPV